jgi:hypothetical protein
MLSEHSELVMGGEELSADLFREIFGRFSASRDLIIDLFAGSFSSALAALSGSRKYIGNGLSLTSVGFEIEPTRYELGTLRLLSEVKVLLIFGHLISPFWGPDDVTKQKIPEETYPTTYDKLKVMPSDLEVANLDAASFNLVIKKSTIEHAGKGLFAKIGMLKGTIIGYYWGRIFVSDRLEAKVLSDRILQLDKYVIGEDGQKRSLFIVACRKCAAGYANDPRTIGKPANAYFEEYESLDLGYQMVALILLDEHQHANVPDY